MRPRCATSWSRCAGQEGRGPGGGPGGGRVEQGAGKEGARLHLAAEHCRGSAHIVPATTNHYARMCHVCAAFQLVLPARSPGHHPQAASPPLPSPPLPAFHLVDCAARRQAHAHCLPVTAHGLRTLPPPPPSVPIPAACPARASAKELHTTLIRNEAAYFGCALQLLRDHPPPPVARQPLQHQQHQQRQRQQGGEGAVDGAPVPVAVAVAGPPSPSPRPLYLCGDSHCLSGAAGRGAGLGWVRGLGRGGGGGGWEGRMAMCTRGALHARAPKTVVVVGVQRVGHPRAAAAPGRPPQGLAGCASAASTPSHVRYAAIDMWAVPPQTPLARVYARVGRCARLQAPGGT